MVQMKGKVYLIGAGPGNAGLLTVEALRIIKNVNIVLYDALVSKSILKLIPKNVKKISVGKKKGEDSDEQQDRINSLLFKYSSMGMSVARLKGGDPFLFGRGGEEIVFLKKNKIPFKVIPGITSAIGVPTYAGLPLTHRDYSSGVIIIPGHLKQGNIVDWENVSNFNGTIVILMGASTLKNIVDELIKNGKDRETPVCIIMNGTLKNQKIVKGKLGNIVEIAKRVGIKAPTVTIIGKVVDLL